MNNPYPKNSLESAIINRLSKEWVAKNIISNEVYDKIHLNYKKDLYSPNLFIRIALFIFSSILIGAAFGLLTLMTLDAYSDTAVGIKLFFYSIIAFIVLEVFINKKKTFRSGIDDALLYSALGLFYSGLLFLIENSFDSEIDEFLLIAILLFPILVFTSIRYVDMLVTAISYLCFFLILFLIMMKAGSFMPKLLPFLGMIFSAAIYILKKKFHKIEWLRWDDNLSVIEVLSLFTFYLSGNYFIVRELNAELLRNEIKPGEDIPLAFIFYAFTAVIPLLYVIKGLKDKDKIMLRCGMILIAVSVLTFKYYFSLGHHEITLMVSGIIMITIAWASMNYLKISKAGLTSKRDEFDNSLLNTDIEALGIAEGFGMKKTEEKFKFGGGNFGGGGASSDF